MHEVVDELRRKVDQLYAMYCALTARAPASPGVRLVPRSAAGPQPGEPLPTDMAYACSPSVQIGDPVGITADDTVTRADASVPLLAIGFCVAKMSPTQCLVRRVGLVPRPGSQAGGIYYLGAGPAALTLDDPFADPAAKIFQRLAVGKNGEMLDACVTLQFVTLRA